MFLIPPKGDYVKFKDEKHYEEKGKEWGLFNKTVKKDFSYKEKGQRYIVRIVGYEVHGEHNTSIIEFENRKLSCINPAYLKEMQSASFSKGQSTETTSKTENIVTLKKDDIERSGVKSKKKTTSKKEKLTLPMEKVKIEAKIKEFSTKYNHFTEEDDDVIIFSNTTIKGEQTLELNDSWCGYSKTLKKLELEVGLFLEFEGKVVEKKFNKETLYKINNPSKIKQK